MRSINIKDALIGALLATVLFMVIGANTENDGQEEIAAVFNDAGAHAVLITNKGTVILVNAKKAIARGAWPIVEVDEISTNNVKRLLAR